MAVAGTRLMSVTVTLPCPPVVGQNHTSTNRPLLPLQVKKEEGQKLQAQKSFSVSRRDAMIFFTTQTLGTAALWSVEPAEARISRSEMKRKLLEKLEQLREKSGIAKPKDDNAKNPSPQPSGKDGNLQAS